MQGRQLVAIREERDTSPEERLIGLCNAGVMAFQGHGLIRLLGKIGTDNAKGEYYMTDAVEIAAAAGRKVVVVEADSDEVAGINTRGQLAHVEGLWQRRAREAAMAAGVTMIAPSTVWFSHDTQLGRDVTLEPNIFFGPGVTVADNVTIRANCHIEGATIASGAIIGPFARLRPGADIGENVHIGDFVEVKSRPPRCRRQGQPPRLYRRCPCRREDQYRRRHHHRQLRWLRQAPDRDRRRCVDRLQRRSGRAGDHR